MRAHEEGGVARGHGKAGLEPDPEGGGSGTSRGPSCRVRRTEPESAWVSGGGWSRTGSPCTRLGRRARPHSEPRLRCSLRPRAQHRAGDRVPGCRRCFRAPRVVQLLNGERGGLVTSMYFKLCDLCVRWLKTQDQVTVSAERDREEAVGPGLASVGVPLAAQEGLGGPPADALSGLSGRPPRGLRSRRNVVVVMAERIPNLQPSSAVLGV